ncbi:MAG: tripartite tricarboxylate transporter substrate binding protein [Spirochaetes bacterium]|nr:MAG: tripartite tricarboxylate transporter substrate binding protein [Spirochaetota bacterium]
MKRFKNFIVIFLTVVLIFGATISGLAQDYPTKPINFLIPFGAGGSADIMGRTLANATKKYLGQPIVPINRPGAGGGIMYTALKNSKPDGYTVGWNSTSVLTATNIGNVPFTYQAFEHVCRIGYTAMPIAVRADSPWKSFNDLEDYARRNPGKIKVGNAGTGSATHLTAVIMEKKAGLQVIHVPLGAGRRVPSLLGGEVEVICVPLPEIAPQVKAGSARILAMPTEKRDPSFPDVPTFKEQGYDIVIELFRGISVPKGTPSNVLRILEDAFRKGSQDASFRRVAEENGFNIDFKGRIDFERYLAEQDKLIADGMKLGGLVE